MIGSGKISVLKNVIKIFVLSVHKKKLNWLVLLNISMKRVASTHFSDCIAIFELNCTSSKRNDRIISIEIDKQFDCSTFLRVRSNTNECLKLQNIASIHSSRWIAFHWANNRKSCIRCLLNVCKLLNNQTCWRVWKWDMEFGNKIDLMMIDCTLYHIVKFCYVV